MIAGHSWSSMLQSISLISVLPLLLLVLWSYHLWSLMVKCVYLRWLFVLIWPIQVTSVNVWSFLSISFTSVHIWLLLVLLSLQLWSLMVTSVYLRSIVIAGRLQYILPIWSLSMPFLFTFDDYLWLLVNRWPFHLWSFLITGYSRSFMVICAGYLH